MQSQANAPRPLSIAVKDVDIDGALEQFGSHQRHAMRATRSIYVLHRRATLKYSCIDRDTRITARMVISHPIHDTVRVGN